MINVFCGGVMKINLFVLAMVSTLLSSPVSAARVDVDFEHPGKIPEFELPDNRAGFSFTFDASDKGPRPPVVDIPARFNPHQGFELAGMRNFHAEAKGFKGLEQASVKISAVPVPAAAWLFLSGLAGMIGLARHSRQLKD